MISLERRCSWVGTPKRNPKWAFHWKAKALETTELEFWFENGGTDEVSVFEVAPSLGRCSEKIGISMLPGVRCRSLFNNEASELTNTTRKCLLAACQGERISTKH